MNWLLIITGVALLLSFITDKNKTLLALKIALKKIWRILPAFIIMLIAISIILYFFSEEQIRRLMDNENLGISLIIASGCGSIACLPGFIAFPLCGILVNSGIKYMVISAFSTTLMMVGIVTFPVEQEYLGTKLGLLRNFLSLFIALAVALVTGLIYGEIF